MKRLLIDDLRTERECGVPLFDLIARNYDTAIDAIPLRIWDEIYLDHDLGLGKSGYDVICWIEEYLHDRLWPATSIARKIICVSANGPGRARIELVIKKLYGEL